MLTVFKSRKEDIEQFKQKIDDLNSKLDKKDNEFQIFLNDLHKELVSTIDQHDIVNNQHAILGKMVGEILKEFKRVEESTINSNKISDEALAKGESLIASSDEMVTLSVDSREAVHAVESLIDNLGDQSRKTSASMNQLSERSKQIEEIVKVISDISSQTNLLALNASIEAARAGEHGKGFSVVADEVRKLAESTKESTADIADLTKKIQEQISKAYEDNISNMNLVNEGMKTSSETSEQINSLLSIITNVQGEVNELLNFIKHQKVSSEDVIQKFQKTTELFDETNDVLMNHIDESEVVTVKLIEAVDKVKGFQSK
ncbi:methyl-accepting chemotaxis protein [Psychrobacillus sp. FSL K6-2836]|uniref:methyl-accepting chemotaxis protein n=1 Tax=Psychrobacillus sp. FSL K6-2836 TaxID=2921548 RepID=UPI0030FBADF5